MSAVADAMRALRSVLLLQEEVKSLKETQQIQAQRLSRLAEAHADLRDRVSRLEGVLEGAAMAVGQRRIEE